MNRLRMSVDGAFAQEIVLTRQETTIGRKPHNDIVIDHLAVSSQHAVLRADQGDLWIEDLKSTNGTYVNGQAVSQRRLSHRDVIELGKVRFEVHLGNVDGGAEAAPGDPQSRSDGTPAETRAVTGLGLDTADGGAAARTARIRVLNGAAAGREILLMRDRTTIGKPGVLVVAIERVGASHLISQVEGMRQPVVNGRPLGSLGLSLGEGDVIELAGTQILFIAP
jgi:hypothetical protein